MPNIMRGDTDTGERTFGNDYYQDLMLWSLPAALAGQDFAAPSQPGGLVDRIIQAAAPLAGKGEATLPLPVVATKSLPRIYHDASFSHGRPPPNCLRGGASISILSRPAVDHSEKSSQSDECDGSAT
jgi:hypothetical protein